MIDFLAFPLAAETIIALLTLTALEIVLGVDNVIFIAILSNKLPKEQQAKARNIGLLLAMAQRILLLFAIGWVISLEKNVLFSLFDRDFSAKDLILVAGGVFLIFKATREIHEKLEGDQHAKQAAKAKHTLKSVIIQILLLDAVFSVDSVLTAVGLTEHVGIMIIAVVVSIIIMMIFAAGIASFVEKHPTIKMLALAILVTIGVLLVAEGFEVHVPRGYLYFAMAFSFIVEMLNIHTSRKKNKQKPEPELPESI